MCSIDGSGSFRNTKREVSLTHLGPGWNRQATRRKGPIVASQDDRNDQWPLQAFLQRYRAQAMPGKGMSVRRAAKIAGISETRWRQVEAGKASVSAGQWVPVMPKPETLYRMLLAVKAPVEEGMNLVGYDLENYPWLLEEAAPKDPRDVVDLAQFVELPRERRVQILADMQRAHIDAEVEEAKRAG